MTVGELRKVMAGLDDNAELEIRDDTTEETYSIYGINAMAIERKSSSTFGSAYMLQFTTDIQAQTGAYVIEEENY